ADAERGLARVREILQTDVRILRRPEPAAVHAGATIAVRCALLPDLSPGERAHLELALRDAAR
ncbi:MAG: hypothetical protein KDE27_28550, partial [Planctomycetes bacterium]|nr:hypothetical protein [Planctomycetota bacterium]